MDAGKTIQKCRWSRNLTQQKLSDISGIPRSTISSIENGNRGTSVNVFNELLDAMDFAMIVVDKGKVKG